MLAAKLLSGHLTPEWSRKIIHIAMGCIALAFPFIFVSRWSVVLLGFVAIGVLLALRHIKTLRQGIGTALLGVSRKSFGEIYFVISIMVVFFLHQSPFEYIIAIAVLTFADSIAALVGISYGRHTIAQAEEDAKSSEGSIIFFMVAFICALVPLQLMTEIGRAEVLVISFLIGLLAAMIEMVAKNGNDNLLLPLLTYSILRENIYRPLDSILINLGIMAIFFVLCIIVYKMTNLTKLSVVYSLLAAYLIMILGGVMWISPPLVLFITFGILPAMKPAEKQMTQNYKVIECNTIIGILALYASVFLPQYRDILYVTFSLSFACHLAINTYSRLINFFGISKGLAVLVGLAKSAALIALPTLFFTNMDWLTFVLYLAVMALVMPSAVIFNIMYDYKNVGDETFRANKITVGTYVAIFTVALILIGGNHGIF